MALTQRGTSDGVIVAGTLGVSVNNTTTETQLMSYNVQGGTMGDYKAIEGELRGRLTTPLISVPSATARLKFGGQTLAVLNALTASINLTNELMILWFRITNDAYNVQDVESRILQPAIGTPFSLSRSFATDAWSVDTSSDQTLSMTWQFGALNLGATFIADRFTMEMR